MSDTLGAIFLIGIFAVATAIIASSLLSQTEVIEVPAADLSLSVEDGVSLKLYNDGGDTIRKAGNIIYVDGIDRTADFETETGDPWTNLEAGNYIELELTGEESPSSVLVVNKLSSGGSQLIATLGDKIISPVSTGTPTSTATTPPTTGTPTPTATTPTPGSPPVADFSGSPTSGTRQLTVTFTDLSTNSPTSWSWTFGDGNLSSAENPSHTYASAGTYTVSLNATNAYGSDTETKTNYITVNEQTPAADFSADTTTGERPLTVTFTDLSTNNPTSWSWTFGDGNSSTAQNPSHTYVSSGTYTVSLTATNSGGSDTETKTNYITVIDPVPSVIFFDDFEDGNYNGWTTSDLVNIEDDPAIGSYSVRLRRNGKIERTVPTTGYTGINVSFYLGAGSLDNSNEKVQAHWFDGTNWNLLKEINNGDPEEDDGLHFFSYNLPTTANNNANFALRFRILGSGGGDRGYVDNVRVEGYD